MSSKLPTQLGGEFFFSAVMTVLSVGSIALGFALEWGSTIVGATVSTAIFGHRTFRRFRDVRLAKFLVANPQLKKLYERRGLE